MANYCDNYVQYVGNTEVLNKIKSIFDGLKENSSMHVYCELPFYDELMAYATPYGSHYSHRFGTKWITPNHIEIIGDVLTVGADTAWSPFLGLSHLIAQKFGVIVRHEYSEPGCDFGGVFTVDEDGDYDDCMSYREYCREYNPELLEEEE